MSSKDFMTRENMYDYVYIFYAFVKILDEFPVIVCLSYHPGLTHF